MNIIPDIFNKYILLKLDITNYNDLYTLHNLILTNKTFNSIINTNENWFIFYKQLKPDEFKLKYNDKNEIISKHINDSNINLINVLFNEYYIILHRIPQDKLAFWNKYSKCSCFYNTVIHTNRKMFEKLNKYEKILKNNSGLAYPYRIWNNDKCPCLCINHYEPDTLEFCQTPIKKNMKRKCILELKKYFNIKYRNGLKKSKKYKQDNITANINHIKKASTTANDLKNLLDKVMHQIHTTENKLNKNKLVYTNLINEETQYKHIVECTTKYFNNVKK